jgi:predicted DNA-binding transcriptional regulator AlpA
MAHAANDGISDHERQGRADQRHRQIVYKADLESLWGIKVDESTLWRWERAGKFPKHFRYGNRNAWFSDEIDDHVNSLGAASVTEAA